MILLPVRGKWRITQKFGENALPFYKEVLGHEGHNGIDLVSDDLVVRAPHDGYVRTFTTKLGGNEVEITSLPYDKSGKCRKSDLLHFASFLVKNGDFIHQGDPVGIMGNSGTLTTGRHCHWTFKLTRNGETLDKGNGYGGALDVLRYCIGWYPVDIENLEFVGSSRVASGLSAILSRLRFPRPL